MRNKFLKGLSVAFAAAMAFTVVSPALTTEAASTKAYVVSEMVDANGATHKYTYDSRGRLTKEVITAATEKEVYNTNVQTKKNNDNTANAAAIQAGNQPTYPNADKLDVTTTVTTVKDMNGARITSGTKTVTTATYNADETAVETTVTNMERVKTFTYYNSGKLKDKTKSANETFVQKKTFSHASTNSDKNGAYTKVRQGNISTAYTYNAKGECVTEVQTCENVDPTTNTFINKTFTIGNNNKTVEMPWTYTSISGYNYDMDNGFANYGVSYDALRSTQNLALYDMACFNAPDIVNTKATITVTKTNDKYNSLGMPELVTIDSKVNAYLPHYDLRAGNGEAYLARYDEVNMTTKAGKIESTFTKVGQPKKQVYTAYDEGSWNVNPRLAGTEVIYGDMTYLSEDGAVVAKNEAQTTGWKNQEVATTYTYTYGKDQNLAKRVANGYGANGVTWSNNRAVSALAYIVSVDYAATEFNYDDGQSQKAAKVEGFNNYSTIASALDLNKYESTTEYDYHTKDNSGLIAAKTSEVQKTLTKVNGKVSGAGNVVVSYKLKKISVPSSRATAVLMDRWKLQTDIRFK